MHHIEGKIRIIETSLTPPLCGSYPPLLLHGKTEVPTLRAVEALLPSAMKLKDGFLLGLAALTVSSECQSSGGPTHCNGLIEASGRWSLQAGEGQGPPPYIMRALWPQGPAPG